MTLKENNYTQASLIEQFAKIHGVVEIYENFLVLIVPSGSHLTTGFLNIYRWLSIDYWIRIDRVDPRMAEFLFAEPVPLHTPLSKKVILEGLCKGKKNL